MVFCQGQEIRPCLQLMIHIHKHLRRLQLIVVCLSHLHQTKQIPMPIQHTTKHLPRCFLSRKHLIFFYFLCPNQTTNPIQRTRKHLIFLYCPFPTQTMKLIQIFLYCMCPTRLIYSNQTTKSMPIQQTAKHLFKCSSQMIELVLATWQPLMIILKHGS